MPLHTESFNNKFNSSVVTKYQITGLDIFEKSLAKYFFSEVDVNVHSSNELEANLNIEFQNNLNLGEVLYFLNTHTWEHEEDQLIMRNINPFLKALQTLKQQNSISIDIEEISILLKDTSIVIKKIYSQSIPAQLENILEEITNHHYKLTRNSQEVPFEMYIPVFEEGPLEPNSNLEDIRNSNQSAINDYFGFWGLYFDSEEDAVIYDLENKSMVYGDLFMLNH
ncbi:hypothetical protein [Sediminicola sp. 1XM1-17]|uniref:hypothetical protein n=1 Tax=Sediminicola sp. 1XM1-17 TaxID=3127702 RepID=UPI003076C0D5